WPTQNIAYVKPVGIGDTKPIAKGDDDILSELGGNGGKTGVAVGKMKPCRIWWPNTAPDNVRAPGCPAPVEPIQMVDGKRFGNGKAGLWSSENGRFAPTRG